MYYDLTKKEYKDYEKKFQKTYVGKQYYCVKLFSIILFIFTIFDTGFAGLDIMKGDSFTEHFYFPIISIISIVCGIGMLIFSIKYDNEVKDYIMNKKK